MFSLNADLFRIVAGFVSKEETRYYLQGVQVERHPVRGAILVATDGHRALMVHDADAVLSADFPEYGYIVKLGADALKACKPNRKDNGTRRLVANSSDTAQPLTVVLDDDPVAIAPNWRIDGSFPDWRRIVPNADFTASDTTAINAAYLATFGTAAKELTGQPKVAITGAADGPLLITFDDDRAFGVLMPLRWSSSDRVPAWLNERPVHAEAAE